MKSGWRWRPTRSAAIKAFQSTSVKPYFFFGGGELCWCNPPTWNDSRSTMRGRPGLFFFCLYISVVDWLTDLVFSQWLLYNLEIPPFIRQTGKDIKCLRRNNMAFRTPRTFRDPTISYIRMAGHQPRRWYPTYEGRNTELSSQGHWVRASIRLNHRSSSTGKPLTQ